MLALLCADTQNLITVMTRYRFVVQKKEKASKHDGHSNISPIKMDGYSPVTFLNTDFALSVTLSTHVK